MTKPIKNVLVRAAPICLLALSLACGKPRSQVTRCPEADLVEVGDDYSIVLLQSEFVESLFGPDWKTQDLFYGFNRVLDEHGRRMQATSSLVPIAKGRPILFIWGTGWEDLLCPIYSLSSRQQVILGVDLKNGRVIVETPLGPREGVPRIAPDGTVFFTDE